MIKPEPYVDQAGVSHETLIRKYSDNNVKIMQVETGKLFDEAVDDIKSTYTYTETNIKIENVDEYIRKLENNSKNILQSKHELL